jgi:iron compound ABC superfamily ATP binding cassette transporter
MKKLRLLFVVLFLLCVTLTACQGNKPSPEKPSPEGYWMLTAAEADGKKVENKEFIEEGKEPFVSIEGESKYILYFSDDIISNGKWEASDKGVKITDKDGSTQEAVIDGQKMVMDFPEFNTKYEFTKTTEKPKAYDDAVKKLNL